MAETAYDFRAIERRWQRRWRTARPHRAPALPPEAPTYFVLVFPPYPNGHIHMGHVRNYTIGDVLARYQRARGRAVLQPIGFDAFGLPNEMEAARRGLDPAALTVRNMRAMRRQLQALGYAYDWPSALVTINPRYYRWNQWLFLACLARDLAYRRAARVQWCPRCHTSLANEQVLDGRCWRCEAPVETRHLAQWFFRLRSFAEEMWVEASGDAYPPNVAAMLRDWLGRTPGAELDFPLAGCSQAITTFTTKPELSWGATYLALSPEHPLADRLVSGSAGAARLADLRAAVRASPDPAALTDGFDTGARAHHPLTGEPIPIWIAAYVDPDFATGAVMGNPCHDARDHTFGRAHGLAGRLVACPPEAAWDYAARGPYLDDGVLVQAGAFGGRRAAAARNDVIADWAARAIGRPRVVFAIRDWCISRQRAWGVPIPVVHCDACGPAPVPESALPVRLPRGIRDTGEGNPLLARPDFVACRCPRCAAPARRETDTMDTFIDTAWYYLRATSPRHAAALCDRLAARRWAPADLYVGGIEIAVPIMLYGSFVTKALRAAGVVEFARPCRALLAHELVLKDGRKMSKSAGNTVDPTALVEVAGADAVRFVVLALAPPLKKIEWSEERLAGAHRLLGRIWALGLRLAARTPAADGPPADGEERLRRRTHETIHVVTTDLERLQPNTCLTALTKLAYALEAAEPTVGDRAVFRDAVRTLLVLLAPFTPHLAAELWDRLGAAPALLDVPWPTADPHLLGAATREVTVKVDARTVTRLTIDEKATKEDVLALAYGHAAVRACLGARRARREIYVEERMLNLVTRE
jgi:leucyl-tRNA synthetase